MGARFFEWGWLYYLQLQIPPPAALLHTQVTPKQGVAAHLGRLIDEDVPGRRGLEAWRALLEAHATQMRQLQTDQVNKTGLDLNEFGLISQLAVPAIRCGRRSSPHARSCSRSGSRALTM